MDVMTPTQRYRAMAHNRGRTGPECALASGLWRRGLRYFTHDGYRSVTGKRLMGKPDIIFPRKRVVIFVDGCFWHGCADCNKTAKLRGQFWTEKIATNRERDQRVMASLQADGWTVFRIPEHDVRTKAALAGTVNRLAALLLVNSQLDKPEPTASVGRTEHGVDSN